VTALSGQAPTGSVLAGIGLAVAACGLFAVMDSATQYLMVGGVPLLLGVWGRYFFQALVTSAVALPLRGPQVLRTRRLGFHLLRGALLFSGTALTFASLRHIQLGEFTAIIMIAPLVTTLLGPLLLKEHVTPVRWLLLAGAFAGTLVIIRPGGGSFNVYLLLPLCQVVANVGFQIVTSKLARTEDPLTLHLYTGWAGALLAMLALPYAWPGMPSLHTWGLLALMGLIGAVGHFLLILAFQRAPATTIMPYLYTQIAFAVLCGLALFGHVPDGWSFIGMGIIAACGMAGAWLTLQQMRRRPAVAATT
jgi:drug/metabolite transporter (DMT)-like permease